MDEERLSEAAILHLRLDVREGVAEPDDVKRLLRMFCRQVAKDDAVSRQTLEYLAEAFKTYLNSSKGIEAALGLKRKVGPPGGKERKNRHDTMMARDLLRLRFEESMTYENAVSSVSERMAAARRKVEEAWAKHSLDAFVLMRLERMEDQCPLTESEMARLAKIYKKASWFSPVFDGEPWIAVPRNRPK